SRIRRQAYLDCEERQQLHAAPASDCVAFTYAGSTCARGAAGNHSSVAVRDLQDPAKERDLTESWIGNISLSPGLPPLANPSPGVIHTDPGEPGRVTSSSSIGAGDDLKLTCLICPMASA